MLQFRVFAILKLKARQLLGFVALAIVQSGAYMRAMQCGLAEYLRIFTQARQRFLRERPLTQADDYNHSVYTSWELSYQQLNSRSAQLLHMMAFLHHEGIPEAIFEVASARAMTYTPEIPLTTEQGNTKALVFDFLSSLRTSTNEWDLLGFKRLTNSLRSFSLLDYDTYSGTYSMHPLVQEWCRAIVTDAASTREYATWLLSLCVDWQFDSDSYALRRRLLPHLQALDVDGTQIMPDLSRWLQLVYLESGYNKENERLAATALRASSEALGDEHPTTLTCKNNLVETLIRQDRLEEVATLLTELIEVQKQVIGQEHPNTLKSMHNLALTYHNQKRWKEAETLFLEVIEVQKQVNGAEHRYTLASMMMLASTYWSQGRLSDAEALYVEVLETSRRVMGREHPNTLMSMHNLAMTYKEQGKLQEAESLMEETVALNMQVRGESHPYTQSSILELKHIQKRILSELESTSTS